MVKNLPTNAGDVRDVGSVPGLGRSPGEGLGNPLQYSCLDNPLDRGAWRATVHRVTQSQTRLEGFSMHTQFQKTPQVVLLVKNPPPSAGDFIRDVGSVPGLGGSPGEENGNLLQYSYLENSMDRGAWQATVHGVLSSSSFSIILLLFQKSFYFHGRRFPQIM